MSTSTFVTLTPEPVLEAKFPHLQIQETTQKEEQQPASQTAQPSPAAQPQPTQPSDQSTDSSAPSQIPETTNEHTIPPAQTVLLLHGVRQQYEVTHGYAIPDTKHDHELLVRTNTIGLNPIDWKSP
jgi:hypothetical protein